MSGDCYEAAVHYILDHVLGVGVKDPNHDLRLVHGEVAGQGPLEGVTYGHAWIEDGEFVIDTSNGRDLCLPKSVYYRIGRIDEIGNTHVYTPEEVRTNVLERTVYGPWDLQGKSPNYVTGPAWEPSEDDEEEYEEYA